MKSYLEAFSLFHCFLVPVCFFSSNPVTHSAQKLCLTLGPSVRTFKKSKAFPTGVIYARLDALNDFVFPIHFFYAFRDTLFFLRFFSPVFHLVSVFCRLFILVGLHTPSYIVGRRHHVYRVVILCLSECFIYCLIPFWRRFRQFVGQNPLQIVFKTDL